MLRDTGVDAETLADIGGDAGPSHEQSPHFVASNEAEPVAAFMVQYSASEDVAVALCECDPANFGLENPEACAELLQGGTGPDTATLTAILTCVAGSFDEAAILGGINDSISVARTTTACIRAEGCAADCDFELTTRADSVLTAVETCAD